MTQFDYTTAPQHVVFEAGALATVGPFIEQHNWRRLMLCTSPQPQKNGTVATLKQALGERLVAIYDQVKAHVPDYQLAEAVALAEQQHIDAVIGLGGGSPIGMAKAVSLELEAKCTGRPVEYAATPLDQAAVPNIAIPTTYAGSEMTPVYGVTRSQPDGSTRKITVRNPKITPRLTIYDPALTLNLPPRLTASTGVNALAHCIEAVYSKTRNPLSTGAALRGIQHITRTLNRCCEQGDDLLARSELMMGAHLGGVALATVAMGIHHGTCHVLGGTAGVPHGVANCIILPHAMRFNSDLLAGPLALVAEAMGLSRLDQSDQALASLAADRVAALISRLDVPQRLREAGVEQASLPKLAENMLKSKAVNDNPKPLRSVDEALTLLQAAW